MSWWDYVGSSRDGEVIRDFSHDGVDGLMEAKGFLDDVLMEWKPG